MKNENGNSGRERSTLKKIHDFLYAFNKFWFYLVGSLILLSIFVLFIVSFIFSKNIMLETMNAWVSLILGIVATLLSIISMLVSFYNLERTNEINEENIRIMGKLTESIAQTQQKNEETIKLLNKIEDKFDNLPEQVRNALKSNMKIEETTVSESSGWED